jgi:hypothetical protein
LHALAPGLRCDTKDHFLADHRFAIAEIPCVEHFGRIPCEGSEGSLFGEYEGSKAFELKVRHRLLLKRSSLLDMETKQCTVSC